MKIFNGIAVMMIFILLSSSFRSTPMDMNYSLTIKVDSLRNSKGVVQFAIYNKEGSIPDEKFKSYYRIGTSRIINESATFIFLELPKGKYAINILHDENKDGKINKGFILPIEGIGFSNYEKIGLTNRPKFSLASFQLDNDATIDVKIIYL